MHTVLNKENKIYLKKLESIKKSEEYQHNQMQINCIKETLIHHADVPEKLLDWLIDAVEKNTLLLSKATKN